MSGGLDLQDQDRCRLDVARLDGFGISEVVGQVFRQVYLVLTTQCFPSEGPGTYIDECGRPTRLSSQFLHSPLAVRPSHLLLI